jgi:putative membrane protein
MVTLVEKYPLDGKKPLKKTIAGLFVFIIFLLIFGWSIIFGSVILTAFGFGKIVVLLLFFIILVFVLKYIYEIYYMKGYFYDATKTELIIRKGVFSRNEITLPFNRIQDIYVDQDILDRIFGLYDVHVSSATIASAFLSHIDGVNKANAEELKKFLLEKVGRKDGE